ncbi:MAG: caspase family protein [Cyanobacteria bacterium]|nr:caspase family protein [Cyanobacteriota bacterium]
MAKVALLIGVGNYEHPDDLKPLVSAPKDVAAMQRILLNAQMGEFSEVIPLIDPDPMQMQEAIETLYRDRDKEDLVLLFFSGHGIKDESGKLYFSTRVTRKTPKGELVKSTAVPARFVQEIMGNSRSRRQVMILDCCFSGAFDPALNAKDDGSVNLQNLGAEGRVVLTSSSSTEYSFEQQGSELSIYTRFLVEGIETGAADRDNDGKVSVRELHEYATKKVQETAPKMNPKIIVLKDEGFDVVFAKAQITDPKLKYRKDAERYSMRGAISPAGRTLLNTQRVRLGLTLEETQEIENQILQPFRDRLKHLEDYRLAFVAEVERQYPLTQETLDELKDLQEILGLREEDVTQIEQDVTAQIANKSETYRQKLQQYEQEFIQAIQGEFPLSQYACEGLDKFQVDLGLTDEDVTRIKQPIIERRTAEHQQQQLEQRRQQDAENLRQQQEAERLQTERQRTQEYQQKLSQYEREFSRAIRSSFPLDNHVREGLKNFQQALNLKDEDIARLETPLLKIREAEYQTQQAEKLRQQQEAGRLQQQEAARLRAQQRRQNEESDREQEELRQQQEAARLKQRQTEACPPSYLVPSILIIFMAFTKVVLGGPTFALMLGPIASYFPPVWGVGGSIGTYFAIQVKRRFASGNYEGAVEASNIAKKLCIIFFVTLLIIPITYRFGIR